MHNHNSCTNSRLFLTWFIWTLKKSFETTLMSLKASRIKYISKISLVDSLHWCQTWLKFIHFPPRPFAWESIPNSPTTVLDAHPENTELPGDASEISSPLATTESSVWWPLRFKTYYSSSYIQLLLFDLSSDGGLWGRARILTQDTIDVYIIHAPNSTQFKSHNSMPQELQAST